MTSTKTRGGFPESSEIECIESIVDILDREMAVAARNTGPETTSDEMNRLVSELLGFLSGDPVEE
jgi:hypothetical protein